MKDFLYLPRWFSIITAIYKSPEYKCYCQKLNHEVKASMNYLRSIVKLLEQKGLIKIIYDSKIHMIQMTEKGRRIAHNIINITSELR